MSDLPRGRNLPTVSICLPASREPGVTENALRSVLAQTFTDFEVLIGDETGASRRRWRPSGTNGSTTATIHIDLDSARTMWRSWIGRAGTYLAVLHDDDWWEPAYLASMVGAIESSPEVGVATCDIRRDVAGSGRAAGDWRVPLRPGRNDDVLDTLVREEWFLLPTCSMWRREVWKGAARAWPPDLHASDLQLFLSAAEEGWAFYYLPLTLAHWVQHGGQTASHLGGDYGLAVADDVLEFWDGGYATVPSATRRSVAGSGPTPTSAEPRAVAPRRSRRRSGVLVSSSTTRRGGGSRLHQTDPGRPAPAARPSRRARGQALRGPDAGPAQSMTAAAGDDAPVSVDQGSGAAQLRLTLYCVTGPGGAHASTLTLLGALRKDIAVTVIGCPADLVAQLAAVRPGTVTQVLPPVGSKFDAAAIWRQVAAVRRARPTCSTSAATTRGPLLTGCWPVW